jgi:hypothetical protein
MTLKKGDLVYRVSNYCTLDDGWALKHCVVEHASDKRITLPIWDGLSCTRFLPSALGLLFFATPLEAIDAFVRAMQRRKASATHAIKDANDGIC